MLGKQDDGLISKNCPAESTEKGHSYTRSLHKKIEFGQERSFIASANVHKASITDQKVG
jgi:hypothetical protein